MTTGADAIADEHGSFASVLNHAEIMCEHRRGDAFLQSLQRGLTGGGLRRLLQKSGLGIQQGLDENSHTLLMSHTPCRTSLQSIKLFGFSRLNLFR